MIELIKKVANRTNRTFDITELFLNQTQSNEIKPMTPPTCMYTIHGLKRYGANQSAPHAETARKRNKTVRILLKLKDQVTLFFVFSCYIDFEIKNEVSFIICLLSFISILQMT